MDVKKAMDKILGRKEHELEDMKEGKEHVKEEAKKIVNKVDGKKVPLLHKKML